MCKFVLSFFFVWERICAVCLRLFISVLPFGIQLSRGEDWNPINWFHTLCIVVHVPGQEINSQCRISWYVLGERLLFVFFIMGELSNHHYFKLLFPWVFSKTITYIFQNYNVVATCEFSIKLPSAFTRFTYLQIMRKLCSNSLFLSIAFFA
jgi:hypothetical protein